MIADFSSDGTKIKFLKNNIYYIWNNKC
jgi:hypothetical protein